MVKKIFWIHLVHLLTYFTSNYIIIVYLSHLISLTLHLPCTVLPTVPRSTLCLSLPISLYPTLLDFSNYLFYLTLPYVINPVVGIVFRRGGGQVKGCFCQILPAPVPCSRNPATETPQRSEARSVPSGLSPEPLRLCLRRLWSTTLNCCS